MPRLDSVCPIRAVSFRMRMWQPIAISQPPPRACPLIAATTGFRKRSMRRTTLLPKRMKVPTSAPSKAEPRSAPAQKILSPAPVMITARTPSSPSSSDRAAFSSRMSVSLMALAGGRLRVMIAKRSSRLRIRVSYAIGRISSRRRASGERPRPAGTGRPPRARCPRAGSHACPAPRTWQSGQCAEQHLGGDLDGELGLEVPLADALLQDRADQREVRGDLLARGPAEELLALAQLDLYHLGEVRVPLEHLEMKPDEPPHLGHCVGLVGDRAPQGRDEGRHLLPEERDEDVFLGLEVEIDGPGRDPGLARDVRHPRAEVALAGEDPNRGLDDLLGLVWIAHGRE